MTKLHFKLGLFYLAAIFFSFETAAQDTSFENDSIIYWSEDRKLSWDDFKFKTDTTQKVIGKALATSQTNIQFINSTKNTIVIAYFSKVQSWSITRIDDVLEHEQLHFDIAELFARKIRKAISELKKKNIVDQNYYDIYEKYRKEWEEYNKLFDSGILATYAEKTITETGVEYALIESEVSKLYVIGQNYWKEKIHKELKELEAYKSPFVK